MAVAAIKAGFGPIVFIQGCGKGSFFFFWGASGSAAIGLFLRCTLRLWE
jgi:hypothetical protein